VLSTTMFALIALLAMGCGDGADTIPRAEVEQEAARQLAAAVDQPEPDISCPGDLAAEVGAAIECELSVEGDPNVYPVYIEVIEVDGGQARFDIEVGDSPVE
jgi:hypothetical protein